MMISTVPAKAMSEVQIRKIEKDMFSIFSEVLFFI